MPTVDRSGVSLYYSTSGHGPPVAFVGDIGYGAWQWAWQHRAVAGPFTSIVYDARGTGRSDCPPGPYDLETLRSDLEAVLAGYGVARVHLVGAGLGGLVALAYAATHDRARTLTLLGSSAGRPRVPDKPVKRLYADRDDTEALRRTLQPVLSGDFRERQPDVIDGIVAWRRGERLITGGEDSGDPAQRESPHPTETTDVSAGGDASREGWIAQAAALSEADPGPLHTIELPSLVIHGTADELWPVEWGAELAENLPRGQFRSIDGASHLVGIERSRRVNDRLVGFLEAHTDG